MARGEAAEQNPQKFGEIVAAACLAHDIGNPPFGHSGEKAIRTWFEKAGRSYLENLTDQQCGDIEKFEGNAGFRVITHLQNNIGTGGLQLTHAVLGAFSKYPRRSHVTGIGKSEGVSEKKFGFVAADEKWFDEVAQNVGLIQRHSGAWARHPLAFLMEAADDICYRIVDLEDGYRLRRVTFAEAEKLLKPLAFAASDGLPSSDYLSIGEEKRRIEYLRALSIGSLIQAAVVVFDENYEGIMIGQYDESLVAKCAFARELATIEGVSKQEVYAAPHVIQIEAAGFEVLGGLLQRIVPCLVERETRSAADKKLLQLIPAQFTLGEDKYQRLLDAIDFVSGMTDTYAVTLYRRLLGIELPRSL
jgi:dGTPase